MQKNKIAIIGYGKVGQAYATCFPSNDIVIYDVAIPVDTRDEINMSCCLAIVCVPTPRKDDGSCDMFEIENVFSWLKVKNVLIKSAVTPGTTRNIAKSHKDMNICVSPEYVGESKYYIPDEYLNPLYPIKHPFQVIGGSGSSAIIDILIAYFGPTVRFMQTTWEVAELAKYMENCFFATKVAFCNEFYDIAKQVGADYNALREIFIADPRVGPMHTAVFKNNRGFGGKCFPKDLSAIIAFSEERGYNPLLLKAVEESNNKLREYENRNTHISS